MLATFAAAPAVAESFPGTSAGDFDFPAPQQQGDPISLHATAYIVQAADESVDPQDPMLRSHNGASLGVRIPVRQWCLAADEGSLAVRLRSRRHSSFVYAGRGAKRVADCSAVFTRMKPALRAALERSTFRLAPSDAPYGVGAKSDFRLVPFRSIAIDLAPDSPVKLGQVLFIPRLRGAPLTLIDGSRTEHDGYVMAVDTGGAIKGSHVDFFEGPQAQDILVPQLAQPFLAFAVTDPNITTRLAQQHKRARSEP